MVRWTAHAKAQLQQIHDYIAQASLFHAKKVSDELARKTLNLDELPRLGRKAPELNEDSVREVGLYSYRILYEIKPDGIIEVLTVIHKRRRLSPEDIPRQ